MIDLAIISHAKTPDLQAMTRRAVETCIQTTPGVNVIVVESAPKISYPGAMMVRPKTPFNYNGYGNQALKGGNSPYIGLFNNDVLFQPGWWETLLKAMQDHDLQSASPYCPRSGKVENIPANTGVHVGYGIRRHVMGWALVLTRDTYRKMGGFGTRHRFWMSDHVYADQLRAVGARHGLVTDSVVIHLESKTLKELPEMLQNEFTIKEKRKYQGQ